MFPVLQVLWNTLVGDVYLRFGTVQRPWQEQDAERDQGVWIEATQTRESGGYEVTIGTQPQSQE